MESNWIEKEKKRIGKVWINREKADEKKIQRYC